MKIKNYDTINPLPLGGWYVRDSGLRRFTFPPGASIPPNSSIKVYAGAGRVVRRRVLLEPDRPRVREHRRATTAAFGDGAYLFDPQGDIRAWMIYPCRIGCADPNQGQVSIDVNPKKDEIITLRNNATWAIDLENYQLKSKPYSYAFPPGSILQPGETMRISTQGDPTDDTQFDEVLGHDAPDPQQRRGLGDARQLHRRPARLHRLGLEVLLIILY